MSTPTPLQQRRRCLWCVLVSAWGWPLSLMAAICVASGGQPSLPLGSWLTYDKVNHLLVFGLLATAFYRAAPGHWPEGLRTLVAIAVTSIFGALDEWHQSFTPGRFVEFDDWLADTLGAIIAVYVYRGWGLYRRVLEWRVFAWKKAECALASPHESAAR